MRYTNSAEEEAEEGLQPWFLILHWSAGRSPWETAAAAAAATACLVAATSAWDTGLPVAVAASCK